MMSLTWLLKLWVHAVQ